MPVDTAKFETLFEQFLKVKLFAAVPPSPPFGKKPTVVNLQKAIEAGAQLLPKIFRDSYAAPLQQNLSEVLAQLSDPAVDLTTIETITGAVYQQSQKIGRAQLRRFSAVISDLYRSFLSKKRRLAAGFPIVETLPPLAMFQNKGDSGPFTIPCDVIQKLFGSPVGVVSLPAVYRDHPVLWTSLAHETGGHDVIHADTDLMAEMRAGVRSQLGGPATVSSASGLSQKQIIALLWDYWMDEAAADIYGVMNAGPMFGHNLAIYFAALNAEGARKKEPALRTQSGFDPNDPEKSLDPHPTDLLRLSLIQGAVENLKGLSKAAIAKYSADYTALAKFLAPDATEIEIAGFLLLGPGVRVPVQGTFPLSDLQKAAYQAGEFIATATFKALSDHSIQDIETWDDLDEQTAQHIAATASSNDAISGLGDDAQLLAGANIALLENPALYDSLTKSLNNALDRSFADDPFWSKPQPDPAFVRNYKINLRLPVTANTTMQKVRRAKA